MGQQPARSERPLTHPKSGSILAQSRARGGRAGGLIVAQRLRHWGRARGSIVAQRLGHNGVGRGAIVAQRLRHNARVTEEGLAGGEGGDELDGAEVVGVHLGAAGNGVNEGVDAELAEGVEAGAGLVGAAGQGEGVEHLVGD